MQLTESQRQLFLAISLRLSNVTVAEKIKATKKSARKNQKSNAHLIAE